MRNYKGQCFCHPTKAHGDCEHCNRARGFVDLEIHTNANEIGNDIPIDDIDNFYEPTCPECGERGPVESEETSYEYTCVYCKHVCDESDLDCVPQEIMQWFIVSRWLYDELDVQREPVAQHKGLRFWGRTCCGQGIEMDGTLQAISRRINP